MVTERDEALLRRAFEVALRARMHGNEPFGAVLADGDGNVLAEAGNSIATDRDQTAHAEVNLVRIASRIDPAVLATATLYASTEPCPMCAGAIFWTGIGRVVYGLSSPRLYQMLGNPGRQMGLRCAEVLMSGVRPTEVEGPVLEEEAAAVMLTPV